MKKRKTIYHLIVDQSGSMWDCVDSIINGLNEQIHQIRLNEIKFKEEEIRIGLTTFNTKVTHHFFNSPPPDVELIDSSTYEPNGSTALLDAIGNTVQIIENEFNISDNLIPTTVVIIILTDGYENASVEFKIETVRDMISRLDQTGKWIFSFIGATFDSIDTGENLSIKPNNNFNFKKSEINSMA